MRLLLAAMAGMSLGNFAVFSSPVYIGSLIDGHGFGEQLAGLTSTTEISAVAVACLLLSVRLDRIRLKGTAISGLVLVAIANIATLWISNPYLIVLVRLASGAGAGMCLSVTSALIAKSDDPDRTVGLLLVLNALIMVVILALMGYAKSLWQFNGYASVYFLFTLILFPCLLLLPEQEKASTHQTLSATDSSNHYIFLGLLGLILFFLFCILEGTIWSFSERSGSNLGISDTNIGLLLALAQFAGLLGATTASVLGARVNRAYPICVGSILMGLTGLTIYQTQSDYLYSIALCTFSFGFFLGFPYIVGAFAKLDDDGRWVARANGLNLLGASVAPFFAATIVSSADYHTLGYVCLALATVTTGLAVAFSVKVEALGRAFAR